MTNKPSSIHPTAIIHPQTQIEPGVTIGPYAVIGEDVKIGKGSQIGAHSIVECAEIGANVKIFPHAFIGTAPQDLKYRGEKTLIRIGDASIVRECATLNRGTLASGQTVIGRRCLIMAYAHVAHDSIIGDEVILANSVAVAGHVQIGFGAVIGGMAGIHQFVQVGRLAMVAAGAMVAQDVPPFTTVWGDRAKAVGLNLEGLRRRDFSKAVITELKAAYAQIFKAPGTKTMLKQKRWKRETSEFIHFIQSSERGVCRPRQTVEAGADVIW